MMDISKGTSPPHLKHQNLAASGRSGACEGQQQSYDQESSVTRPYLP